MSVSTSLVIVFLSFSMNDLQLFQELILLILKKKIRVDFYSKANSSENLGLTSGLTRRPSVSSYVYVQG